MRPEKMMQRSNVSVRRTEFMEYWPWFGALLRFDGRELQYLAQLIGVVGYELAEIGR
jgi:hypothetical protein